MRHTTRLALTAACLMGAWLGSAQAQNTAKPGYLAAAELTALINALPTPPQTHAGVAAFLAQHRFDCSAMDGTTAPYDSRLSMGCEVYEADSDDPSPWPQLILGVSRGQVVAAWWPDVSAMPGAWQCPPVEASAQARICFTNKATAKEKALWKREWAALATAAD